MDKNLYIKELRKKLNLDQKEFCDMTGLNQSNLSQIENYFSNVELKRFKSIVEKAGGEVTVTAKFRGVRTVME